jgi:prolyl oligopeptidase
MLLLFSCSVDKESAVDTPGFTGEYPESRMDSTVIEDYFGVEIADPYRWLEDDQSEETKDWVKRQNAVTFSYLDRIPYRSKVKKRLEELWNFEKYGTPEIMGGKYYYFKNDGLQNQSVLYGLDSLDGEEFLVLDPNTLSEDGTTSLGSVHFSHDGRYMAYQVSEGGSDWRNVRVLDLSDLETTEDSLSWIKFSDVSWTKDGFYYSRYPEPQGGDRLSGKNEYHAVYFHKLGTPQGEDELIYVDREFPQRNAYSSTTSDGEFLLISASASTSGNSVWIKETGTVSAPKNIVPTYDFDYEFISSKGNILYFLTNENAPQKRLMSYNVIRGVWSEVIPESDHTIQSIERAGDFHVVNYIKNATSQLSVFDLAGSFVKEIELPGIGTVGSVSGSEKSTELFFSYTSFLEPAGIFRFDLSSDERDVFRVPEIAFDPSEYVTNQVWYTSYDGTSIPMFVTHKKGLEMTGQNPTLLYGYGGFDNSILPSFKTAMMPLLEMGGIYAVANIRGGGEFGKDWHKAGILESKQNVFDDFQAAAEYLISEKYTSPEWLAIEGRSNGGLLVGACMTQRPDLYKVAFPAVGVLDMLRYHQFTIGWAWAADYGRSDDSSAFDYLIKYSPLHNIKEDSYPATLVTTADHDDRVVPAHSFKFIATLQEKQQGENPVLIRIETSAGHGSGKPVSKQIEESADMLSFMFYNMGLTY